MTRGQDGRVCRGIRGAIGVDGQGARAVPQATWTLLDAVVEANGIDREDVAAVLFTVTEDLLGSNPAAAARAHGWSDVPLLVVKESGEGPVERCLRVLVLWNTSLRQREVRHVWLQQTANEIAASTFPTAS